MLHDGKRKGSRIDTFEASIRGGNLLNFLGVMGTPWEAPSVILDRDIVIENGGWTISGAEVPEPRPKRARREVDRLVL